MFVPRTGHACASDMVRTALRSSWNIASSSRSRQSAARNSGVNDPACVAEGEVSSVDGPSAEEQIGCIEENPDICYRSNGELNVAQSIRTGGSCRAVLRAVEHSDCASYDCGKGIKAVSSGRLEGLSTWGRRIAKPYHLPSIYLCIQEVGKGIKQGQEVQGGRACRATLSYAGSASQQEREAMPRYTEQAAPCRSRRSAAMSAANFGSNLCLGDPLLYGRCKAHSSGN